MKTDVSKLYLDWLIHIVWDKDGLKVKTHRKLIEQLHKTPFFVLNPNDQPREDDGVDLRWRFAWEYGHAGDDLIYVRNYSEEKCSILEMMVALAFRADEEFTKQINDNSTVQKIFWDMVKNLGLLGETDNVYDEDNVAYILERFNRRLYKPNGKGGLFYFPYNDTDDMRQFEIWYQLCWYINDKNGN